MELQKQPVTVYLICAVCLSLFLTTLINSIVVGGLLLYCIPSLTASNLRNTINSSVLRFLLLYYGMLLVAVLYSSDTTSALFTLEKKLAFLFFPAVLPAALVVDGKSAIQFIIRFFSVATLVSGLALVGWASFRFVVLHDNDAFNFETFTPFNYVYYSLYFTCASLFLLVELSGALRGRRLIFFIGLMAYSIFILFMVSSKMGIGSFALGSILIVIRAVSRRKILIFLTLLISLLSVLFTLNQTTRDRFLDLSDNLEVLQKDKFAYDEPFTGLTLRLVFWKIGISETYKNGSILCGAGTGDAQNFLNEGYKKYNLDAGGYTGWDPHNQWVFTFVQLGIVGLLLVGGIFISGIRLALRTDDLQYLVFLIMTFLFSLTESILESNKGIIFFALFATLFAIRGRSIALKQANQGT